MKRPSTNNVPAEAKTLDLTLTVPRAPSRTLKFVDPGGRAIRGVMVRGLVPLEGVRVRLDGSEVEILGLEPGQPRPLIAFSNDGKYAIKTFVSSDNSKPKTIRLEPASSITGRTVDGSGKPMKALLSAVEPPNRSETVGEVGYIPQTRSDADGRFRIGPLLPGQRYSAEIRGGATDTEVLGKAFENVFLLAGEVRDLGDIRIKPSADTKSGTKPEK